MILEGEDTVSGDSRAIDGEPAPAARTLLGVPREVIAISIARFCDAFGNSVLFVVLPLYFARFAGSGVALPEQAAVGFLIALYAFVSAPLQPVVGWLSDRMGHRKPLILVGLALVAASTLGFGFATLFVHLVILRMLQGIGVALTIPTSFAVVSISTPRRRRATAMAFYTTSRSLGFTIGPPLGGILYVLGGAKISFVIASALILLGLAFVAILLDERRIVAANNNGPASPPRVSFFSLFRQRGLVVLGMISLTMGAVVNLLVPLEKWANQRLEQTAVEFGLALSASLVAGFIFQIPAGKLSDRIGRKPLIIIGLALLAPAVMLTGFAGSTLVLIVTMGFQGFARALMSSPSFALAADIAPQGAEAKQMSVLTMSFGLGMAFGPLMSGFLAGYFFYEMPFIAVALLALVCLVFVLLRLEEQPPVTEALQAAAEGDVQGP